MAANYVNKSTTCKNSFKEEGPDGSVVQLSCRHARPNKPQIKILIPPRYKKLFPEYSYFRYFLEQSYFLPDSVALELITKECHFSPKNVTISTQRFSAFLKKDLIEFFKDVDSLSLIIDNIDTIRGESSRKCSPRHNSKAKKVENVARVVDVPSKVLYLILSNVLLNFQAWKSTLIARITSAAAQLFHF